jgi:hypothetical protein
MKICKKNFSNLPFDYHENFLIITLRNGIMSYRSYYVETTCLRKYIQNKRFKLEPTQLYNEEHSNTSNDIAYGKKV